MQTAASLSLHAEENISLNIQRSRRITRKPQTLPTCGSHLDTLGLSAGFADPCRVVGSDAEVVLSQRLQARLDVVRRAFAARGELRPAPRLARALRLNLHYVALHRLASVVAGTRPGQDQGLTRQLGHNGLGRWWVWSVCRKFKSRHRNVDVQVRTYLRLVLAQNCPHL